MSDEIKVALLGNGILREGLHRILSENSFSVTSATKDVDQIHLPSQESKRSHDIILIDGGLTKHTDELYADLQERYPTASLVVLADSFEFEAVVNAFRSGVAGYIIKDISPKPLVESLRLVALGEKVLPSEMAMFLGTRSYPMGWSAHLANVNLSEREIQVLQLLILGAANKVIGRRLGICEATVKVHVKAALRKLHVSNRTQAAIWAVQRGLIGYGADGLQAMPPMGASPSAPAPERNSVN
jgi:two-component system nitrate/nitrite response regulator NarL